MSSFNKSVILMSDDVTQKGATWAELVKQRLRKKREGTLKMHGDSGQIDPQRTADSTLEEMEAKIKSLQAKEAGHPEQIHHKPHPSLESHTSQPHSPKQSGYADYSEEESANAFRRALRDYDEE